MERNYYFGLCNYSIVNKIPSQLKKFNLTAILISWIITVPIPNVRLNNILQQLPTMSKWSPWWQEQNFIFICHFSRMCSSPISPHRILPDWILHQYLVNSTDYEVPYCAAFALRFVSAIFLLLIKPHFRSSFRMWAQMSHLFKTARTIVCDLRFSLQWIYQHDGLLGCQVM
jgi:hypothetical protein